MKKLALLAPVLVLLAGAAVVDAAFSTLDFTEQASAPSLSPSGHARMYAKTDHTVLLSVNGGAYAAVAAGTNTIAGGGTNSAAALSGSSIMTSNGSAIVQGAAGTTTTLLHGNAGGAPTYSAVSMANDVTGTLAYSHGGFGFTTATQGDLFYASATDTPNKLAVGGANTLLHGGATVPAYSAVVNADVSGTINETHGGTHQSTYTRGDVIYASAADTLSKKALCTSSQVYRSDGTDFICGQVTSAQVDSTVLTNGGAISGTTGAFTGNTTLGDAATDTCSVTGQTTMTYAPAPNVPGATADWVLKTALTTPIDSTGNQVHDAIQIPITVGNATGGPHFITGIDIPNIGGDAQVGVTAIQIGAITNPVGSTAAISVGAGWPFGFSNGSEYKSSGPAVASVTTGSCSSETCTGPGSPACTDSRGEVTATCTAGQTAIVAFSATLSSAPVCVCSPANAAGDPVTSGSMFCRASSSSLTITATTAITAGAISYWCLQ